MRLSGIVTKAAELPIRLVDGFDDVLGDGIEALIAAKHRRRLARLGWSDALESPERALAEAPIRTGNHVEVLIDGAQAMPAIAESIAGAREFVHITGWHTSPGFRLDRGRGGVPLRDLLAQVSQRVPVRLLMWGGPPVPVFHPTRREVRRALREFTRDSDVRMVLDTRERTMHCHHEKLVVVDGKIAYVGGIDMTDLISDRYDENTHPKTDSLGWHDCATALRGPIVADVDAHFRARWSQVAGEPLPAPSTPEPAGALGARLVRTIPERTYDFAPCGEFTNLATYLHALRGARDFVYLENQFLWSPEIVSALMELLVRPPSPEFRMVLVLPLRPENGKDATRGQLGKLIEAAGDSPHLLATTLLGPTAASKGVYVHAKVGIVDDAWMIVGSANLNEHSLFNDTEVGVVLDDPTLIRQTRLRLWGEHLRRAPAALTGPVDQVVDRVWVPTCDEQDAISAAGGDPIHRIRRLDGLSRRVDRLRGPLGGLLVDG